MLVDEKGREGLVMGLEGREGMRRERGEGSRVDERAYEVTVLGGMGMRGEVL